VYFYPLTTFLLLAPSEFSLQQLMYYVKVAGSDY